MTAEDIYYDEDPEQAKQTLAALAESGDPDAMFYLGHLAEEESPRQETEAFEWYRAAAGKGHLEGSHWMASYLYHGIGVPQNVPRALEMFEACAERGYDGSQWKLGQHYLAVGIRVEEAKKWLASAAAQGHTEAARLLREAG